MLGYDVYLTEKINVLEGVGLDQTIPDRWNADHVGLRLVEAFEVMERCPKPRGPKPPGNCWMAVVAEPDDKSDLRPPRVAPTNAELWRMEAAFAWLLALRQADSGQALMVGLWAYNRAVGNPIKEMCARKQWALSTFFRNREKGIVWIAEHLNRRATPVF